MLYKYCRDLKVVLRYIHMLKVQPPWLQNERQNEEHYNARHGLVSNRGRHTELVWDFPFRRRENSGPSGKRNEPSTQHMWWVILDMAFSWLGPRSLHSTEYPRQGLDGLV
jgi:hypothetical protein